MDYFCAKGHYLTQRFSEWLVKSEQNGAGDETCYLFLSLDIKRY